MDAEAIAKDAEADAAKKDITTTAKTDAAEAENADIAIKPLLYDENADFRRLAQIYIKLLYAEICVNLRFYLT